MPPALTLVSVIPVAQVVRQSGLTPSGKRGTITLFILSIEQFDKALMAQILITFRPDDPTVPLAHSPTGKSVFLSPRLLLRLTDDMGNHYEFRGTNVGSNHFASQGTFVSDRPLDLAARLLTVTQAAIHYQDRNAPNTEPVVQAIDTTHCQTIPLADACFATSITGSSMLPADP